jgi:type IV secretion system protein VirD4
MALFCRLTLIFACWVVAFNSARLGRAYYPLVFLTAAFLAWRGLRTWRGGWAHGTARVATLWEMMRAGMLTGSGLVIGRAGLAARPGRLEAVRALLSPRVPSAIAARIFLAAFVSPRFLSRRMIRIRDYTHLGVFAPSGKGKGVSIIIPTLLSHPGACVVTDPKGENYKITAEARRRMGQTVIRIDPFKLCGDGADAFNPLDCIGQDDPDLPDQCLDVANMLVMRTGKEQDPHWNDKAELSFAAFLTFICACEQDPGRRNLLLLRELVTSPKSYAGAISVMQQSGGVLTRKGDALSWLKDKELSSVMSTIQRHSEWLDSPAVEACLQRSSFDPRILRSGNATLYLILPSDRLVTLAPLMRLWLGSLLRILSREATHAR